jgi:precorrin-2 dehydrogenase/sirohydrochlorin ferrochelatase
MFVRLSGRDALVVGGGAVGTRKVRSLLAAGSSVTVVSPAITRELRELVDAGKVSHIEGTFLPEHLDGRFLCVSAVDDPTVGESVSRHSRRRGVLVNVADDPDLSDFFFPAIVSRGDLVIAVSSGGVSPTQVKKVRELLEERFGPEYGAVTRIMGVVRESLRGAGIGGERLSVVMDRTAALPLGRMIAEGRAGEIPALVKDVLVDTGVDAPIDIDEIVGDEIAGLLDKQ